MSIIQYLKETRGELRHVAWPTRTQTIVYTILVALLSVSVSLYLGLFDYLFTTGLSRGLSALPASNPITVTQQPATTSGTFIPVKGIEGSFTIPSAPSTDSGQAPKQ